MTKKQTTEQKGMSPLKKLATFIVGCTLLLPAAALSLLDYFNVYRLPPRVAKKTTRKESSGEPS